MTWNDESRTAAQIARKVVSFELRERARAVAAFDAMAANLPKEPPSREPLPAARASAAYLAMLEDRRAGLL